MWHHAAGLCAAVPHTSAPAAGARTREAEKRVGMDGAGSRAITACYHLPSKESSRKSTSCTDVITTNFGFTGQRTESAALGLLLQPLHLQGGREGSTEHALQNNLLAQTFIHVWVQKARWLRVYNHAGQDRAPQPHQEPLTGVAQSCCTQQ